MLIFIGMKGLEFASKLLGLVDEEWLITLISGGGSCMEVSFGPHIE